ncbi:rhodanese-like domain-containing protein [Streptomyces sp. NPDC058914]|uniref:rhodanese-like domain-containing protein n=1 Tax=Streptomyces TaxID=1883 RepID=UPI0036954C9F
MPFSRRGPGRLTVPQARRRRRRGTAAPLDVRASDGFRAGHAPGAPHVLLSPLMGGTATLPAGRDLLPLPRSGDRSRRAAALPAERGATAVDVVRGIRDRAVRGLPVEDARGTAGTVL